MAKSPAKTSVARDLGVARTARDVRVDVLGFAGELQQQFVGDVKTKLKLRMLAGEIDLVSGDYFEGLLVPTADTSIDVRGYCRLYKSEQITEKQFLSAIAVSVSGAKKFLTPRQLKKLSKSKAGTPSLRVTRKDGVDVRLVDALKGLSAAASPSFRAWTASADATAALARAHHTALPSPADGKAYALSELEAARPFAVCDVDRAGGFVRQKVAERAYQDSGTLILWLEDNVDPADENDYRAAETKFMNRVGGLLDDMAEASGADGFLTVYSFTVADGPQRGNIDSAATEGDYHAVTIRIEWGP